MHTLLALYEEIELIAKFFSKNLLLRKTFLQNLHAHSPP